jgi:CheY-like chemotaxis protein
MANILTVEDEALVRILLVETLEAAGHAVREAPDGEAALAMIKAGLAVDILVSDVRMPKLDGYGLAVAAREINPSLPVIFMTGYSDAKLPAALAGSRILRKPFNPDDLVALVEKLLAGGA